MELLTEDSLSAMCALFKKQNIFNQYQMLPESIEVSLLNKFKEQFFFPSRLILVHAWDIQLYLQSWLTVTELMTNSSGHKVHINFK